VLLRKLVFVTEEITAEAKQEHNRAVRRAAALAIIANPFSGQSVEDLSRLFDIGADLGRDIMPRLAEMLGRPAIAYGKGALVGLNGDLEHGAALIHPKLGQPMRAAVGGGEAIIPSNCKVAPAGATLDVPLGHKDNVWSFDHLETLTVSVPDAPRPDEILIAMAISDSGRPWPRVGKGRAA
jgi:Amino acid synthesis